MWGGGHESFYVDGYDCSGSVSFLLHHAGLICKPVVSREFTSYGSGGKGRWITIYAKDGHVFAVVAGLRLDTTGFGAEDGPRWRLGGRPAWGFVARHPDGLLRGQRPISSEAGGRILAARCAAERGASPVALRAHRLGDAARMHKP